MSIIIIFVTLILSLKAMGYYHDISREYTGKNSLVEDIIIGQGVYWMTLQLLWFIAK